MNRKTTKKPSPLRYGRVLLKGGGGSWRSFISTPYRFGTKKLYVNPGYNPGVFGVPWLVVSKIINFTMQFLERDEKLLSALNELENRP